MVIVRHDAAVLIRRELPTDRAAVRAVLADAFEPQRPGEEPVEVGLVDALRQTDEWLPPLSMVAIDDHGELAGYVVCTRAWVDDRPVLGLGPLAVQSSGQRRGTGSALMHAVLGAADALGEPLVVLLGHTDYYPRFGFRPAGELGIVPPVAAWGPHFQARPMSAYQPDLRGQFRYAPPFEEL